MFAIIAENQTKTAHISLCLYISYKTDGSLFFCFAIGEGWHSTFRPLADKKGIYKR